MVICCQYGKNRRQSEDQNGPIRMCLYKKVCMMLYKKNQIIKHMLSQYGDFKSNRIKETITVDYAQRLYLNLQSTCPDVKMYSIVIFLNIIILKYCFRIKRIAK